MKFCMMMHIWHPDINGASENLKQRCTWKLLLVKFHMVNNQYLELKELLSLHEYAHSEILQNDGIMQSVKVRKFANMTLCKTWFKSALMKILVIKQQTHTQLFYSSLDFVRDNSDEPVSEETFTHSHLSWSALVPYLLPPSIMVHGILSVQFMCLTVFFHNLSPSFLWSASWPSTLHFILHTFLHPIILFFSQHMPIPSQPFLL